MTEDNVLDKIYRIRIEIDGIDLQIAEKALWEAKAKLAIKAKNREIEELKRSLKIIKDAESINT
jgi:ribosomal protein L16/L10AE